MRTCEPQMTKLFHFSVESATCLPTQQRRGLCERHYRFRKSVNADLRGKKYYNFTRNCREAQGLGALVKFRKRSVKILETGRLAIVFFFFFKVSHSLPTQLDDFYCCSSQQFIILTISSLQILPCKCLETSGQRLQKVPQPLTF